MSGPWTDNENAAVCALYFAMLDCAVQGAPYNKRAMIRDVQNGNVQEQIADDLRARSKGSIEAKLMNCTAAHEQLAPGAESMNGHGYRPLTRFQLSLKDAMRDALVARDNAFVREQLA